MTARKPANGAPRRTVQCAVTSGPFAGWAWTAQADFKAKVYGQLQSGDVGQIIDVLDSIVISHNFPDFDDPTKPAASIGDVDSDALEVIIGATFDAIGKLPSR